jgi:hypothetical protein
MLIIGETNTVSSKLMDSIDKQCKVMITRNLDSNSRKKAMIRNEGNSSGICSKMWWNSTSKYETVEYHQPLLKCAGKVTITQADKYQGFDTIRITTGRLDKYWHCMSKQALTCLHQ